MRRLSRETRCQAIQLLNDGMSIRAVSRFTGVYPNTLTKLVADAGRACAIEHHRRVQNLTCAYVQADEIWSYVGQKTHRMPKAQRGQWGRGDVYVFIAIDPETKLIVTWLVGPRDRTTAVYFLRDLSATIRSPFQLSTDAAAFYAEATDQAFRHRGLKQSVDYAQIWKHSVAPDKAGRVPKVERTPLVIRGEPDPAHIGTTFVERHNLTMRMALRRFTRRTNAFSKKVQNHGWAVATYMFHYNFVRPHGTLSAMMKEPTTPAMAAGLAEAPWRMEDLVRLIEAREETARDVARRRKDRRAVD